MMKWLEKNYIKIINIMLLLMMVNLLIYILYGSKSQLNSDSTFIVDYANEQIRTHSLFPKNWINANDFWIYSLIPLINIFLKVGFNFFMSRQISVLIQSILLFTLLIDLFKNQLKNKTGLKIILLLFLSGISSQFLFELFGDATYGSIIFYMLFELWLFIKYIKKPKNIYIIIFTMILTMLTMCSLRFPIYITAPLICCVIYFIYNDGFIKKYKKILLCLIAATLIGYILNSFLSNNLILYKNFNKNLTNDSIVFTSAIKQSVFDYFWICGGTGLGIRSLSYHTTLDFINTNSPLVVLVFIKFIYAIITLLIPIFLIKKFKKFTEQEKIIYIFTISFSIIILFFLIIGGLYTWFRYITPVIFFLNLLYSLAYKYIFKEQKNNKYLFIGYIILCVLASIILSTTSYYNYKYMEFKTNRYQGITEYLTNNNLKYGYIYAGKEQNLYKFLSEGKVQINTIDRESLAPFYWLNSKDWYTDQYYNGEVFFIRKNSDKKIEIEKEATEKYKYNEYEIFVFKNNSYFLNNIK